MISAIELNELLAVLKSNGVTGFRFKEGEIEMEVGFAASSSEIDEEMKKRTVENTNAIGFHVPSLEEMND